MSNGAENIPMNTTPARPTALQQTVALIGFIVLCFAAAAIGGAATSSSVNGWFQTLNQPSWAPPNWLFGPVWTALYLMMAVAAWLVWRSDKGTARRLLLILFGIQLVFNIAWSVIFFGLQSPGWAFAEILLLWLAIGATALAFKKVSTLAALLLLPYLAWTSFAAILNFAIWKLNS